MPTVLVTAKWEGIQRCFSLKRVFSDLTIRVSVKIVNMLLRVEDSRTNGIFAVVAPY